MYLESPLARCYPPGHVSRESPQQDATLQAMYLESPPARCYPPSHVSGESLPVRCYPPGYVSGESPWRGSTLQAMYLESPLARCYPPSYVSRESPSETICIWHPSECQTASDGTRNFIWPKSRSDAGQMKLHMPSEAVWHEDGCHMHFRARPTY